MSETTVNTEVNPEKSVETDSSKERLLRESKDWKQKAQAYKAELEAAERERLEKDRNFEELAKKFENELKAARSELTQTRTKVLKSNIRAKIQKYAGEVHSVDDLLNQSEFKDILSKGINESELDLEDTVAQEYVTTVLKAKPYLKKPVSMGVNTTKPTGVSPTGQAIKPFGEMSPEELKAAFLSGSFKEN